MSNLTPGPLDEVASNRQTIGGVKINVSTTFFPSSVHPRFPDARTNLIIQSSDGVFFYVTSSVIDHASTNRFGGLLPLNTPALTPLSPLATPPAEGSDNRQSHSPSPAQVPQAVYVQEEGIIVNLLLHWIYGIPCEKYGPDLETIARAFTCFPKYGLTAPPADADVYSLLLKYAPNDPMRTFAICAGIQVEPICILASQHTLNANPYDITEADALIMGPVYLRRLLFLHLSRQDALRRLLSEAPLEHGQTPACSTGAQRAMQLSWRAAATEILMKSSPQRAKPEEIRNIFVPLVTNTVCTHCRDAMAARLEQVVEDWNGMPSTI